MTRAIRGGLATAIVAVASLLLCDSTTSFTMQSGLTPQTREFLRLAREELASSSACTSAAKYLRELPLKQQLRVARAILNDVDARIGYVGATTLIEHGRAREAVPALAAIIASGRAETQLNGRAGYDWIHGDDQTLFLRMAISINRYLLSRVGTYHGEERTRVEEVLMGGLLEKPREPFSEEAAQKLIAEWESKLRRRRRTNRETR